jgi:ADP-heptose:LPS heptosyltransferase
LQKNEQEVHEMFRQAGWGNGDLKVIIHPAASLPAKQWPLDRFASVMRVLRDRHHARFIYTGAKGDAGLYREIEQQGPFQGLDLCGQTSLRENISVYRAASLFFGVDSGPMHVAAASGIPVVALFGPTDERKWGPWGDGHRVITKRLSCYPCKPHKCDQYECMTRITVDEALEALETSIGKLAPRS